ncbi:acyl-CoA dehydrogenase family protein [Actinospica sp. MGRD01-02]|uniref:Acyl-CoA dehydrogenase family protein n=1 Tax=Actinospica acidithermotolerans TaxID=2828514 RepID=A0A941EEV8_9ACTN|nr:acyl-CoA dehydrogenase family protein [Actinospica acidithermotolerans]MBR7830106.1 acyl-CoA dehydrogenase family protein [Actinospica acidithermotolerans]
MDAIRRALLPTEEAQALFELTEELGREELAPRAAAAEAAAEFPRDVFRLIGRSGLLGLPYDEEYGGGSQPYAVYLQVVEELARHWLAVGLGVSVHTLSCHALAEYGTDKQRKYWLPDMIGGEQLGAYCLSEPEHGSDAANLTTRAAADGDEYVIDGTKAWITHGGQADFYTVLARTGEPGARGISAFLVDSAAAGLSAAEPEHKMGMRSSTTSQMVFEGVRVPAERQIGELGQGFEIAMRALDCGRLGIAACAVGVAQAALDTATAYAKQREQFGKPIIRHEAVGFLLADMAARTEVGRAAYLAAARLRDLGLPFARQAAIAKLHCTDAAMQTTIDAVQVLGGAGYTTDFPVERYLREAKVLQIVEGTNQIQRRVIAKALERG